MEYFRGPVEWANVLKGLQKGVAEETQKDYERELHMWMSNGWFVAYPEERLELSKGLISLMGVLQQNKSKIHPVMDF